MKKTLFLSILIAGILIASSGSYTLAGRETSPFHKEIVSSRGRGKVLGIFNGIAVDPKGNIHMSCEADNMDLLYVTNAPGTWTTTVIEKTGRAVGKYSSIAVDSNNNAHVVYFDYTRDEWLGTSRVACGNLKYATNKSGEWDVFVLEAGAGMIPRICIDKNDNIHIIHVNLGVDDVSALLDFKYTTNRSGSWKTITIKSGVVKGSDPSIAVDSNGKVHISCRNEEGVGTSSKGGMGGLRYITNASGEWTWQDVDTIFTAGYDGSIAVDSNGKVHICYLDKKRGLKYAANAGGAWRTRILDGARNVGWNTSIVADSNDKIHISYSDPGVTLNPRGNGYLKYVTNEGGDWKIFIVDKENAGYTTAIAVGKDNKPHFGYYVYKEGMAGELKHAWK